MSKSLRSLGKIKSLLSITSSGVLIFAGYSLIQGNEKFYNNVAMPVIYLIDPEISHRLAIIATKLGLVPVQKTADSPVLYSKLWDIEFKNPLGIAAGFDKHGEAVEGLHKMGFGFVEIGSVTPKPQEGNKKPRIFRLIEDHAIINRYGFNSEGHNTVISRLEQVKNSGFNGIIGVNLGKNMHSLDPIVDFLNGIRMFSNLADYFVINVSSPNTPGLRNLQNKQELQRMLTLLNEERLAMPKKPPLLLKIAPDLSKEELKDIATVVQQPKTKVDGIIISNTTLNRMKLISSLGKESGGLSGAPIADISTIIIANMYQLTNGKIPIIGVGGIFNGFDAYEKIKAGASLVQIYTSFAYYGPPIVPKIKQELSELLLKDGYKSVNEAIGKGSKKILSKSS